MSKKATLCLSSSLFLPHSTATECRNTNLRYQPKENEQEIERERNHTKGELVTNDESWRERIKRMTREKKRPKNHSKCFFSFKRVRKRERKMKEEREKDERRTREEERLQTWIVTWRCIHDCREWLFFLSLSTCGEEKKTKRGWGGRRERSQRKKPVRELVARQS